MPVIEAINVLAPLLYEPYPYIPSNRKQKLYHLQLPLIFPFTYVQVHTSCLRIVTNYCPTRSRHSIYRVETWLPLWYLYMFHCPILSRDALDGAGGKKLRLRSNLALLGQFGYESAVFIFDMRHWISSLLQACKRWVVAETFGLHKKEKKSLGQDRRRKTPSPNKQKAALKTSKCLYCLKQVGISSCISVRGGD